MLSNLDLKGHFKRHIKQPVVNKGKLSLLIGFNIFEVLILVNFRTGSYGIFSRKVNRQIVNISNTFEIPNKDLGFILYLGSQKFAYSVFTFIILFILKTNTYIKYNIMMIKVNYSTETTGGSIDLNY